MNRAGWGFGSWPFFYIGVFFLTLPAVRLLGLMFGFSFREGVASWTDWALVGIGFVSVDIAITLSGVFADLERARQLLEGIHNSLTNK